MKSLFFRRYFNNVTYEVKKGRRRRNLILTLHIYPAPATPPVSILFLGFWRLDPVLEFPQRCRGHPNSLLMKGQKVRPAFSVKGRSHACVYFNKRSVTFFVLILPPKISRSQHTLIKYKNYKDCTQATGCQESDRRRSTSYCIVLEYLLTIPKKTKDVYLLINHDHYA